MFCPNCKTEYRDGFTRCSDCGANLVTRLREAAVPSNHPTPADGPELLWTGIDAGLAAHIESALDSAKVSYQQRTRDSGALPGFSEPVYAIFTHARDHEAAHAALDDVIRRFKANPEEGDDEPDTSDVSAAIPDADDEDDEADVPHDYVPDDFDPAEATVEVWSGADATMRNNLVTFLGGIGIGSAIDDSAGKLRIRVTPSSQKRALGMIRQVIDAS